MAPSALGAQAPLFSPCNVVRDLYASLQQPVNTNEFNKKITAVFKEFVANDSSKVKIGFLLEFGFFLFSLCSTLSETKSMLFQIPLLTSEFMDSIPSNSLVRYRGMVS